MGISITQIVLEIIAGIGGIGIIFIAVVKWSSDIIASRLEKKYSLRLSKEMEEFKATLEGKKYVSKTRFDTEFIAYKELSKAFTDMVKTVSVMFPSGYATYPADKELKKVQESETYQKAYRATEVAQDLLASNIAFITEELYEGYEELRLLSMEQLRVFESRFIVGSESYGKEGFSKDDYERTRQINDKWKKQNIKIRDYLNTINVII